MCDILLTLGVFAGLVLLIFLSCKFWDWIDDCQWKKRRKQHPEFFRLREDYSDKADEGCRWHNKEIAPRKRNVKALLEEEPYWPKEVYEQKMEEVEKLRREIYTAEIMERAMDKTTEEARQKVVDYVRTHNIKWAGVWE